eukprot:Skav235945  [mRNA]  locus=scaffold3392:66872:72538:- [translate_table: standard]
MDRIEPLGFLDGMKGDLKVLDLACGRGQDLQKYSREHRLCKVELLVCIDVAESAIEEAKRRYGNLWTRARREGRGEFKATFHTGDLRVPATLLDLVEGYQESLGEAARKLLGLLGLLGLGLLGLGLLGVP